MRLISSIIFFNEIYYRILIQDKIEYIRFRSIGIGIDQFYPVEG